MRTLTLTLLLALAATLGELRSTEPAAVAVGHPGNPLLAPLYAAAGRAAPPAIEPRRFATGGDVGYALLSGELDAGFVEPAKALALLKLPGAGKLAAAGVIEFPYGAALVLRKGFDRRLGELGSARVAASDEHCALLGQFRADAARLGADTGGLRLRYMPFDAMLPALEAGSVDAIVTRGSFAVLAAQQGHAILYQNWKVADAHGDTCCPAIIAQAEYLLLVRSGDTRAAALTDALAAASKLPGDELRRATARHVAYPAEALAETPVASFVALTAETRKALGLSPRGGAKP